MRAHEWVNKVEEPATPGSETQDQKGGEALSVQSKQEEEKKDGEEQQENKSEEEEVNGKQQEDGTKGNDPRSVEVKSTQLFIFIFIFY